MKPDSRKCTWSVLIERRTEAQPDIKFTPKALKWIKAMVDGHSGEIGFFGIVREEGSSYIIDEIFYPRHCLVTGATCEIAPEGSIELAQKLIDDDRIDDVARVRFWGHSHHSMGTTPSDQDDAQAMKMMHSSGAYVVRAICNNKGEISVSFFDNERQLKFENVKWSVVQDYDKMVEDVISITNLESNSKEKVQAIRKAIETKIDYDDEEYKAIVEEVKELKKIQLPEPAARGIVQWPSRYNHNFRRQDRDDFFPNYYQSNMFDNPDFRYGPNAGWPQSTQYNTHQHQIDKKKDETGPLLTDEEISSVVNTTWEGI